MKLTQLQKQAVGLDKSDLRHFQQQDKTFLLHKEAVEPFALLKQESVKAGFELAIVSAYRDFDRQLLIWNEKAAGKRELLDSRGKAIDVSQLSDKEKLYAILRWSAIPGTSRHHWGTDIDVVDVSRLPINEVELIPAEGEEGGPCYAMHEWLDQRIANNESFGFFRPYNKDSNSVAPERWHLSFLPVAEQYSAQITPEFLLGLWQESELLLFEALKTHMADIWDRYICYQHAGQPAWVASS